MNSKKIMDYLYYLLVEVLDYIHLFNSYFINFQLLYIFNFFYYLIFILDYFHISHHFIFISNFYQHLKDIKILVLFSKFLKIKYQLMMISLYKVVIRSQYQQEVEYYFIYLVFYEVKVKLFVELELLIMIFQIALYDVEKQVNLCYIFLLFFLKMMMVRQ